MSSKSPKLRNPERPALIQIIEINLSGASCDDVPTGARACGRGRMPRERGHIMRSLGRPICATILGLAFAVAAAADTLELKDGRVLQGRYLGGTQAVLRFEINGEVKTFPVSDAVAVTFTGGASASAYSTAPPAPAAVNPPPAAAPPAAAGPDSSQRPVTSTDVMAPPAAAPTSRPAAAPQQQPAPDPAAQYGMITIP